MNTYILVLKMVVIGSAVLLNHAVFAGSNHNHFRLLADVGLHSEDYDAIGQSSKLEGTYYLEKSRYTSGPMAERDFLTPLDLASLSFIKLDTTSGFENLGGYQIDASLQQVKGHNIYLPRITYIDFEGLATYGVGFEYMRILEPSAHLSLEFSLNEEELANKEVLATSVGLGYKKLFSLNWGQALGAEFKASHTDTENESRDFYISTFGTTIDYYISRRFGIGLDIYKTVSDIQRQDSSKLGVHSNFYFTPGFGLELEWALRAREEGAQDFQFSLSSTIFF